MFCDFLFLNQYLNFQLSVAQDDDYDDVDLFCEETEEEKKAAEKRVAAVKAFGKKKKCEFLSRFLYFKIRFLDVARNMI